MNLKEMLIKEGIVKTKNKDEEPFTLKSGKKSRLFIDIKEASLNPLILKRITQNAIRIITEDIPDMALTHAHFSDSHIFLFDKIASVAVGGVPIATALSLETNVSQIIVRSEKHDRGTQSQVIGDCKNKRMLLIEDVATSGGSIINAVRAIREAGGICNDCIVVVDRQEGAKEWCGINDINLISLLKKSDFGIDENILKGE